MRRKFVLERSKAYICSGNINVVTYAAPPHVVMPPQELPMKKVLLLIVFLVVPFAVNAAQMQHPDLISVVGNLGPEDGNAPVITAKGNMVRVQNADGKTLEVFDITGRKIASLRIDSPDRSFILKLRRGLYLLRVDDVSRKTLVN